MSIIRWLRGSALVCTFAGPAKPLSVEDWSLRHSKRCSPDELIASVFIASIVANYDDWKCESTGTSDRTFKLFNTKKNLEVRFNAQYNSYSWELPNPEKCYSFLVKTVSLDQEQGREIVKAYSTIHEERAKAKRLLDKIRREQEEADRRWNLAEELLGMKRDATGALVPVKTV